jgi:hypothetical protein
MLACAAMFVVIILYRGLPSFAGGGRGATMWFAAYLGTLFSALVPATILVLVVLGVNRSRRVKYKTPRRDFVLAATLMLFLVLAGSPKAAVTTNNGVERTKEERGRPLSIARRSWDPCAIGDTT